MRTTSRINPILVPRKANRFATIGWWIYYQQWIRIVRILFCIGSIVVVVVGVGVGVGSVTASESTEAPAFATTSASTVSTATTSTTKATTATTATETANGYDLRWISSGGGWRSMGANMAYANIFQQVGILSETHCNFTSIAAYSGGTWFTTQLFYSKPFLTVVLTPKNGVGIYNFLLQFVQSLIKFYTNDDEIVEGQLDEDGTVLDRTRTRTKTKTKTTIPRICTLLSVIGRYSGSDQVNDLSNLCFSYSPANGNHATLITELFRTVSSNYNDPTFVDRIVNSTNRLQPFQQTEHHVLIGLSPTSKLKKSSTSGGGGGNSNEYSQVLSYIGGQGTPFDMVFTVPIPFLHVVPNSNVNTDTDTNNSNNNNNIDSKNGTNDSFFFIGTEPTNLPLEVRSVTILQPPPPSSPGRRGSTSLLYGQWEDDYPFCPGSNGSIVTYAEPLERFGIKSTFNIPFQGGTKVTVSQLNAATSSFAAALSGLVPSILMQSVSTEVWYNNGLLTRTLLRSLQYFSSTDSILNELSVCSQWPNQCTRLDGRLVDGGYAEGLGIAMNIGRYHSQENYNFKNVLKLIVTHNNVIEDSGVPRITSYFNTSYNEGIEPGEFIWEPSIYNESEYSLVPVRSCQIFNTYLDYDMIQKNKRMFMMNTDTDADTDTDTESTNRIVPGTNITTMIIETTTITNTAFQVKAGQPVQILFLQLNSVIDFFPLTIIDIQAMAEPLAQLALDISNSTNLVEIIQDFLNM